MSITTDILTKLKTLIESTSGTENVYDRKITYNSEEDWVAKFEATGEDEFKGVEIWRSGKNKILTSFLNKVRNTFTFTIVPMIGAKDSDDIVSFNTLRDQVDAICDLLDVNLTLDETVTDSEFCTFGDQVLDIAVGNTFWVCEITKIIHKDVIEGSIS